MDMEAARPCRVQGFVGNGKEDDMHCPFGFLDSGCLAGQGS